MSFLKKIFGKREDEGEIVDIIPEIKPMPREFEVPEEKINLILLMITDSETATPPATFARFRLWETLYELFPEMKDCDRWKIDIELGKKIKIVEVL